MKLSAFIVLACLVELSLQRFPRRSSKTLVKPKRLKSRDCTYLIAEGRYDLLGADSRSPRTRGACDQLCCSAGNLCSAYQFTESDGCVLYRYFIPGNASLPFVTFYRKNLQISPPEEEIKEFVAPPEEEIKEFIAPPEEEIKEPIAPPEEEIKEPIAEPKKSEESCPVGSYYSPADDTCKTIAVSLPVEDLPANDPRCDSGWKSFENKCYQVKDCGDCPWGNSDDCQLASVHKKSQSVFLAGLVKQAKKDAWLGLKRIQYTLTDSKKPMYTNWDYKEPSSPEHVVEYCVAAKSNGKWADFPCSKKIGAICKHKATNQDDCGDYATVSKDGKSYFCYEKVAGKMTWSEGQAMCQTKYKGKLAEIRSKDIDEELAKIRPTTSYWIGVNRLEASWSDNSPLDFEFHNENQELHGDEKFCTYLDQAASKRLESRWSQKPCMETLEAKVCQKDVK